MLPRRGHRIEDVRRRLNELALELQAIPSSAVGTDARMRLAGNYVRWASAAEQFFRSSFEGFNLDVLHTQRYWHIRRIDLSTLRPEELIRDEVELQLARLRSLDEAIGDELARARERPGRVVVLDTSALLHHLPPTEIEWAAGTELTRLVVPLRVVEELDMKTSTRRDDLAKRARNALRDVTDLVGDDPALSVVCGDGTTIEVQMRGEPWFGEDTRPRHADAEILAVCEILGFVGGAPVALASGDAAMRLQARTRGIDVYGIPERFRVVAARTSPA